MKTLPPRSAFYNKLKKEEVKQEEYDQLVALWNKLGFRELRDLATLYLTLDVLLLGNY